MLDSIHSEVYGAAVALGGITSRFVAPVGARPLLLQEPVADHGRDQEA